jgi:hypothetical protein
MKIQKYILISFLFVFVSMMSISCGEDTPDSPIVEVDENEKANDKLDGEWNATSLRIDGVETIGWLFQKVTMDFDADKDAATGDTSWELLDFEGSTNIVSDSYEIKNDGEEFELDGDEFDLHLTSNSLDLEGNIGGEYWEIQAEAK